MDVSGAVTDQIVFVAEEQTTFWLKQKICSLFFLFSIHFI